MGAVRAPKVVATAWSIVKGLLPEHTRAKVSILGKGNFQGPVMELLQTNKWEDVPAMLGGQADDSPVAPAEPVAEGLGTGLARLGSELGTTTSTDANRRPRATDRQRAPSTGRSRK